MKLSKLWDLKEFLKSNGMKQKYFASQIGVTSVPVSNWMRRKSKPTPLTQKRIEKYIQNYYEAKYPSYYSWCCGAEAEGVFTCRDDSSMKEGTCTKCWKLDYVSIKKKEKINGL